MKSNNTYFELGSKGGINLTNYYKIKTFSAQRDAKQYKKLKDNSIEANNINMNLKVRYKLKLNKC